MHFRIAARPGRRPLSPVHALWGLLFPLIAAPTALAAQQETIHACYVPLTGTVYLIKQANLKPACASSAHVEFSWNAQGQPGADGAQGQPGADGAQGPPGGLSGWQSVLSPPVTVLRSFTAGVAIGAQCPVGKAAIGGGYSFGFSSVGDPATDLKVTRSVSGFGFTGPGIPVYGWNISVINKSTLHDYTIQVEVVCATINAGG